MARKDNLSKLIREEWPAKLDAELKRRYNVECLTCWNSRVIQGQFETSRVDGWPLSPEMVSFIHGYMIAMNHVYIWNGESVMQDGFYIVEVDGKREIAEYFSDNWSQIGADYNLWCTRSADEIKVLFYVDIDFESPFIKRMPWP